MKRRGAQRVWVPVWPKGQLVRHADGSIGRFRRYHPWLAGWVIVRMRGGYDRVAPAAEWQPLDVRPEMQ